MACAWASGWPLTSTFIHSHSQNTHTHIPSHTPHPDPQCGMCVGLRLAPESNGGFLPSSCENLLNAMYTKNAFLEVADPNRIAFFCPTIAEPSHNLQICTTEETAGVHSKTYGKQWWVVCCMLLQSRGRPNRLNGLGEHQRFLFVPLWLLTPPTTIRSAQPRRQRALIARRMVNSGECIVHAVTLLQSCGRPSRIKGLGEHFFLLLPYWG